jgi:hypothetical protein
MYIYIIREREFRRFGEPVWKPGMTTHESIKTRFGQYPKGSELIFAARVSDALAAEKDLMQLLAAHRDLIHRKDIGREYFQGELSVVYNIASMVCARYIKAADWEGEQETESDSNQSEDMLMDVDDAESITTSEDEPAQDPPLDSHMAIIQFVNDHRETLNRANMTVADVYRIFKGWLETHNVLSQVNSMQSKTFTQSLCKLYKATYSTACLPNGQVHPTLKFPALIGASEEASDDESEFQNNFSVWLEASIEKTDNHRDVVLLNDIMSAFVKSEHFVQIPPKFARIAKRWFTSHRYIFKDKVNLKQATGKFKSTRNVVLNARMV